MTAAPLKPLLLAGRSLAAAFVVGYACLAVFWGALAIVDDPAPAEGGISLHGWGGALLAAVALAGAGLAALAWWGSGRLWRVSRPRALYVVWAATAVAALPVVVYVGDIAGV